MRNSLSYKAVFPIVNKLNKLFHQVFLRLYGFLTKWLDLEKLLCEIVNATALKWKQSFIW